MCTRAPRAGNAMNKDETDEGESCCLSSSLKKQRTEREKKRGGRGKERTNM